MIDKLKDAEKRFCEIESKLSTVNYDLLSNNFSAVFVPALSLSPAPGSVPGSDGSGNLSVSQAYSGKCDNKILSF